MSDTKALYDVVEKALANWGNGETQDAFEALWKQMQDTEARRLKDNEFLLNEARNAKQAAIDGAEAERQRMPAEVEVAESGRAHAVEMLRNARATLQYLGNIHEISEHAYQELDCHLSDEPSTPDGEPVTTLTDAHNAALEEAAKRITSVLEENYMDATAREVSALIRALKKTGQGA